MKMLMGWVKRHRFLSVVLLFLPVFAIIVIFKMRSDKRELEALSEPVGRGAIVDSVYGIGTVMARNSFQLRFGVTSIIQKIFVAEGDHIQRGQKLVALE